MLKPIPDPAIVKALKRIDKDLSVEFLDPPQRWAIMHSLQVPGNVDKTVDMVARQLAKEMRADGYVVTLDECIRQAGEKVRDWKLVCYVTEDDGSYRPLDGRIVEKLQRMDFLRRNVGLREWRDMLQVKADEMQRRRERASEQIKADTKNDRVFQHCLSNILWGVKTKLHVQTGMGHLAPEPVKETA